MGSTPVWALNANVSCESIQKLQLPTGTAVPADAYPLTELPIFGPRTRRVNYPGNLLSGYPRVLDPRTMAHLGAFLPRESTRILAMLAPLSFRNPLIGLLGQ
jgi:hypothetical protein